MLLISFGFWNEYYPLKVPQTKVLSEASFKAIHRRQDWFLMNENDLKIKFSCLDIGKVTCKSIYSDPNFLAKDLVYIVFPETCGKHITNQDVIGNCEGILLQGKFYSLSKRQVINFKVSEVNVEKLLKKRRFRDNFFYPVLFFLVTIFLRDLCTNQRPTLDTNLKLN